MGRHLRVGRRLIAEGVDGTSKASAGTGGGTYGDVSGSGGTGWKAGTPARARAADRPAPRARAATRRPVVVAALGWRAAARRRVAEAALVRQPAAVRPAVVAQVRRLATRVESAAATAPWRLARGPRWATRPRASARPSRRTASGLRSATPDQAAGRRSCRTSGGRVRAQRDITGQAVHEFEG